MGEIGEGLLRAKLRAIAPDAEPIRTLRGTGYALNDELPDAASRG